jgi:hypothetical protein
VAEPSRCCDAPVVVAGDRSTHWYACTRCGQATDPVPYEAPSSASETDGAKHQP